MVRDSTGKKKVTVGDRKKGSRKAGTRTRSTKNRQHHSNSSRKGPGARPVASPQHPNSRTDHAEHFPAPAITKALRYALSPTDWAMEVLSWTPDSWQRLVLEHGITWGQGNGKRLAICAGRQTGKTETCAVYALWFALHHPATTTLIISAQERAAKEFLQRVTGFLHRIHEESHVTREETKLTVTLQNGSRVVSLPSTEAAPRGFTCHLLIEDESARVDDDVHAAARPTTAATGGKIILLSTPFGQRGHFWQIYTDQQGLGGGWDRVSIRSDQCPRISPEYLAMEKASNPDYVFRSEYLCEFLPTDGLSLFSYDDIMSCMDPNLKPIFEGVPGLDPTLGAGQPPTPVRSDHPVEEGIFLDHDEPAPPSPLEPEKVRVLAQRSDGPRNTATLIDRGARESLVLESEMRKARCFRLTP